MRHIWTPLGATDLSRYLAQVPSLGVDGFLMAGLPSTTQAFIDGLPRLRERLGEQIVGGVFLWSNADAGAPVGDVVAAEALGPKPLKSRFLADFQRVFPDLGAFAWDIWSVYFYIPMEAALLALEAVDGDLGEGHTRFRAALSRLVLEAPNGTIRLDEHRQAIAPSYLVNYRKPTSGPPVLRPVRTIARTEQTFNGYFSPDGPPLGRDTIVCKRHEPPSWARR